MSKLAIISRREYLQRVKTRGFVIFTLLLPALMGAYIFVVIRIARSAGEMPAHLAVVDLSGKIFPQLQQILSVKTLDDGSRKYTLEQVPASAADLTETRARLQADVLNGRYTGYLVIPADVLTSHNAEYHARNAANMAERQELGDNLRQAVLSVRLIQLGVPRDELARTLGSKFDLNTLKVGPAGESEEHGQTFALAYFSSFLLYMTLLMYGMIVMRSVVEEKTSRVAEVVLSSADPFSMLMGKIFGITGAGLTQYAVWAGFLGVAGAYFAAATYAAAGKTFLSEITVGYVVWLIVFFVLGLILYASLYAAIGAIVSSDQEAQQSQLPVTLLVIVALILALKLMNDPSSTSAIVLSEVPFFAPILMPTRIAIAAPPLWQIALSIVLCAATMVLLVKTSAKIYRLGLLMTGKRPTLPELVRWLRYA